MRILFLSNFYPPASRGGYEQWCQEVAEGLRNRGHDVLVLTSNYAQAELSKPDLVWIRRELNLEMEFASFRNALHFFTTRKEREAKNLTLLCQTIEHFAPDTALIWGMWNIPRSLPALAEELMPGRVAYYMGDFWPFLPSQHELYWQSPARNWATSVPKSILSPLAQKMLASESQPELSFDHVLFPTLFMREEFNRKGITPKNARVTHGAIDTEPYLINHGHSTQPREVTRLLFVGRLTEEKGVHIAIEAANHLVHQLDHKHFNLTIVGNGDPEYETYLRKLVKGKKLASFVTFMDSQPKEAMPALYHQSDIFLFTSLWPEPFGRVIVEAMASGIAVIGSAVGGAAEIMVDGVNALTYPPDDHVQLAQHLVTLFQNPSLKQQLQNQGRKTATTKFDLETMTNEIETYLDLMSGQAPRLVFTS